MMLAASGGAHAFVVLAVIFIVGAVVLWAIAWRKGGR